jgi:NitT/TauT family transport system substrate-binding protein
VNKTNFKMTRIAAVFAIASAIATACAAPPPAARPAEQAKPAEGATAVPAAGAAKDKVVWVSPRGTLEVMDDYPLWVAKKLGYFDQLGLDVELQPGPLGGANVVSLLTEKKADVSFPSPGVLAASRDAGIPVTLAFEMFGGQVFDFAVPADSDIKSVKDLEGKTIALGSIGWQPIVDPILAENGVDPKSVKYVEAGQQWGQTVDQKKADAALAWEGLRAQWESIGLKLKFLIGSEFSKDPSNGYVIRADDLKDPKMQDVWKRFFRALAMGLEFGRLNPQAAGEITYNQFPALKDQMTPELALESMRQLAYGYNQFAREGKGYGYSDLANWQSYFDRVHNLGQVKQPIKVDDAVTNMFIEEANNFDKARVEADAKSYPVSDTWKNIQLKGDI